MRIAINAVGEIGVRAGRIIGAERDLSALGVYGDGSGLEQDRRTIPVSSLEGFDVLVTDDVGSSSALAGLAAYDGLACAVPGGVTQETADRFAATDLAVLTNCSVVGLAATLAVHEAARTEEAIDTVVAWTTPGKPLRRGVPIAFPDPIGAKWGRKLGDAAAITRLEAPVDGPWAGAAVTVLGPVAGETHTRIVGVADERPHLEAIALAAGAVAVAATGLTGALQPEDLAEEYLQVALRMGLGVAAYSLDD